jgi:hypothetical protein
MMHFDQFGRDFTIDPIQMGMFWVWVWVWV